MIFLLKNYLFYTAKQKYFILKYFFDSVSKPSKVFFIGKTFVGDYNYLQGNLSISSSKYFPFLLYATYVTQSVVLDEFNSFLA